jgi:hypothetical protein
MSNKRITDLTELTNPTTDDVFPVVDIATNTTTKVQLANLPVQTAVTTALATKQATLVSGTNIKTVNSTTLLGSGDVAVQETLVSGTNIKTLNNTSLLGSGNITLTANPSGVAGAIQFSNGSAFASDASNLFWDDTNNRLGVGTNVPSVPFEVLGNAWVNAAANADATFSIGNPSRRWDVKALQSGAYYQVVYNNGLIGQSIDYLGNVAFGNVAALSARVGIKGSGSTSATTSLLVQNSAGTTLMSIADNGAISIGAGNITTLSGTVANYTGPIQALYFVNASSPFQFGIASVYGITGTTPVVTSGQRDGFLGQFTFAPTSGTAILNVINASPTINQTGGANGITRALYINPTLTAAADFRAIEVSIGGAYINTTSVQASAILQADSTTKGFLPPRMTTTQKNAIATPAAGLVVYDSTTNKLCCYNGSTWNDLF